MRQNALKYLVAFLFLSIAAVACSSSSDVAPLDEGDNTLESSAGEEVPTTVDLEAPVDPENIRQLTGTLTGLPIEGEQLTCMVANTEGDTQLTALFNGFQAQGFEFSPEAFTALTVNVHECVDPIVLSGSLIALSGGVGDAADFTSCVAARLSDEQTGDLAYTGLSALGVNFPVPEGAQEITIDAASSCIGNESLAAQFAAAREQASGFTEEVDLDCLNDGLDDEFTQAFWRGAVTQTPTTNDLEPLIEGCSSGFDSGLAQELPADFVAFSGEGALAGVDPSVRNNVYTEPPEFMLEDGVDYQAILTTTDGEILIDLYEDAAPITVNSFVALARDGFYDQTSFHRVLDGFMAQAGDPTATGSGGPGFSFDDEESGLTPINARGLLAMANSGPNTNGSQFFITLAAADWLDGLHTVFGEVLEGDDVLGQVDLRDPAAPTSRGETIISIEITEN